jgi:hypothetical protein
VATEKVEVFEKSYSEVLAALKHQDDKLNRTLTALAFLTAAGVAIYVNLDDGKAAVKFADTGPSVGAVLFVVFMAAVALALLSALSAIGPGKPLESGGDTGRSLLFYPAIARREWTSVRDKSATQLTWELTDNYHHEAREIAYRTRYKVARARESGAFVQLAIVSLTLLGIFETRPLSVTTRWWIAAGLITVVLLAQFMELVQMKGHKFDGARWGPTYIWLLIAVILAAAMLVRAQAIIDDYWEALGYALGVLLLSRLAIVSSKTTTAFVLAAMLAAVPVFIIAVWT